MTESKPAANPGYVLGQLSRALQTADDHPDPDTRQRAQEKVARWEQIFRGMLEGTLDVGSRTPVQGAAPWVTLEVAHGGFATGDFSAGGPLQPHERDLLRRLGHEATDRQRATLNIYYVSEAGQAALGEMLRSGRYRVHVPEEAALLTVAWLTSHGQVERAHALLEHLTPFFDRLRFYPVPDALPLLPSPLVKRRTTGEVLDDLDNDRRQLDVETMNETLGVWLPLYDRVVALFLETVEGTAPSFTRDAQGILSTRPDGLPIIEGGWPCRSYPDGWKERATTLLEEIERLRQTHVRSTKPVRKKDNFARLRQYLRRCVERPEALTGRDVGMIRKILASSIARHGAPGSPERQDLRARQLRLSQAPLHSKLRQVVVQRVRRLPPDSGLESLAIAEAPVSADEQGTLGVPHGTRIPAYLGRKLEMCWLAPVEVLVERGIIPSGEVLAQVSPQLTSQVRAAGISDPDLRRLYGAVYTAFRRRRSLLLLNLEHQVRLSELPWVSEMDAQRGEGLSQREQARQSFDQLATLAVTAFPYAIFPNKLVQEFRDLASSADLKMPFVDELAADIFRGAFTEKFLAASKIAAGMLRGSLYERYYGLPYRDVLRIDDVPRAPQGAKTSEAFGRLCIELAGPVTGSGSRVAANGKVIEQSQILTTQNLAPVFEALGLHTTLRDRLPELTEKTLQWVCRQQSVKVANWRAELQRIKNCAYAWRQMIFYLSLSEPASVSTFLSSARTHLATQPLVLQERFRPVFEGLVFVAEGGQFDVNGTAGAAGELRRFLGWTTGRHWLAGPDTRPGRQSREVVQTPAASAEKKPWWRFWG